MTLCSTGLDHQMSVMGIHPQHSMMTLDVIMTLCSTGLDHQMSVAGGTSACEILNKGLFYKKTNESGSLKVVPWCSNTLDCWWKDMSE